MATIDEQIEILNKDTENIFKVPTGNSVAEEYNNCKNSLKGSTAGLREQKKQ